MIKANELVVGRWFNRKHGKGWTWIQIDEGVIRSVFSDSLEYALNDFEPIPLTPEILIVCGFDKRKPNEYGEVFGFLNFTILYARATDGKYCYFLNGYHNDAEVVYLNQLQNLYFALTGNELEIKL